jgi:hypothetical protein
LRPTVICGGKAQREAQERGVLSRAHRALRRKSSLHFFTL